MIGEWSVGAALFHLGALESGHQHLEKALTLYDPAFHGARVWQTGIEPGIFCRCELSRTADAARVSRYGAGPGTRGGRRCARARSPTAAGLRAALRDLRPPRAAIAARSSANLRSARRGLSRARDRAGAALGRPARRPGVHRAGRSEPRAARARRRTRGAHDDALRAPSALLSRAPGRRAVARRHSRPRAGVARRVDAHRRSDRPTHVRRRARAAPGGSPRRPWRARRRRAEVPRGTRDIAATGRAVARAPSRYAATPTTSSSTAAPPKRARCSSPSSRGSPKAATRWTISMLRG